MDGKHCLKCKQFKEPIDFAPNRNQKDGLHGWCRECSRAYRREYEKTHPRPYSVRKRDYHKADKNHIHARSAVAYAIERHGFPSAKSQECMDCKGRADQYDHYKGYDRENWLEVQAVCTKCSAKRDIVRGNRRRVSCLPS